MNLTINSNYPNQSFGIKVPTEDCLNVVTGKILSENGMSRVRNVCGAMAGKNSITTLEAMNLMEKCAEALKEQFPILKISAKDANEKIKFGQSFQELKTWINNQIKQIGSDELDITPLSNVK